MESEAIANVLGGGKVLGKTVRKPDDPAVPDPQRRTGLRKPDTPEDRLIEHCDLAQIGANGAAYSHVKNVQ